MKKIFTLFVLAILCCTQQVQAQDDFRLYKGKCWGLFYYYDNLDTYFNFMPISYVRVAEDCYLLPDFAGCGKDLYVYWSNPDEEGYNQVKLGMDGAGYDTKGSAYFYPPFSVDGYDWTIKASCGEYIGSISQANSYYHGPLDYLGLFYYSYAGGYYAYLDVKFEQDYDEENHPREYIDDPEEKEYYKNLLGIRPLQMTSSATYYDLAGRRVDAAASGIKIARGRKFISK